jgi:hypothetical protein
MRLPIDTTAMTFFAASDPEPLMQHDSDRQRVDRDGQPLITVRLVTLAAGDAEILTVRLAGAAPKGLAAGAPVRCVGLSATPWQMADRAGITYRADRVEPIAPARQAI